MFANVFLKSLRDQRRALIGWSIGLAALVFLTAAIWPSFRDMPDLDEFLANYPEGMRKLFNTDAMTSGTGFLNAELFTVMVPLLFIVFAIGRGARLIAGEEESGTLEVLLVTPLSTWRLLLQQAAALAAAICTLGVLTFVVTVLSSAAFGMGAGIADIAAASLSMVLLGIEHGWLALAVGAVTGRRVIAIAVTGTVAMAGYLLYALAAFVEGIEPWKVLSPFHQAIGEGPLGTGLPATYLWMPLAAVIFVAVALPIFDRRDIAAH